MFRPISVKYAVVLSLFESESPQKAAEMFKEFGKKAIHEVSLPRLDQHWQTNPYFEEEESFQIRYGELVPLTYSRMQIIFQFT